MNLLDHQGSRHPPIMTSTVRNAFVLVQREMDIFSLQLRKYLAFGKEVFLGLGKSLKCFDGGGSPGYARVPLRHFVDIAAGYPLAKPAPSGRRAGIQDYQAN